MRDRLYWAVRKFSFRFYYFVFFDTGRHLAVQLFARHGVRVWFDCEVRQRDFPYRTIKCHVKKRDAPKFLDALEDLKNSMLICGNTDYETEVSRFMDYAEKRLEKKRQQENDSAEKAKKTLPA